MTEHYCVEHETEFFKKGRMRGFSHPIGDTGNWCNEPEEGGAPIPEGHTEETKYKADPAKIKSIERQSSLKASVEIACALIAVGKGETYDKTITRAVVFESYLDNGATVTKK